MCTAGLSATPFRRQLKQDTSAVNIVSDLISGDTNGAGAAIAAASANNDVAGISSALASAAALVSLQGTLLVLLESYCLPAQHPA